MSRGGSFRTSINVDGDLSAPFVRLGNLLCHRTALLLYVVAARFATFIVEQPGSSVLEEFPAILQAMTDLGGTRTFTWLGAFGHSIPKSTYSPVGD